MSALLAVQNADVLRALGGDPPSDLTVMDLARELGRDESNLRKSLKKLRDEDFIDRDLLALTTVGAALLPRLDVLDGHNILPPGFSALLHRELAPHRLNPRRTFDLLALDELRQDILQSGGLTSSLLVRSAHPSERDEDGAPNFWIVAGERRWRAIGHAIDDGDLPADYRLPCQIRTMSDAEHLRLSIGENIQRVDLDHVELGRQFEALLLTGEDTPQSIAERISKTPEYVQQHVRILRISDDELAQVKAGEMTFKQALAIVAKPKPKVEPAPELNLTAIAEKPAVEAPKSYAAVSGRNEAAPKPAPALDPAVATFDPSPKMRLILLEVAHKVAADDMARFREGYTPIAAVPAGGGAPELVRCRAIGFRSIGGRDEVRIDPRGPVKDWLDRIGWDRDDAGISLERARSGYQAAGYLSEWLNVEQTEHLQEPQAAAEVKTKAEDGLSLPKPDVAAEETVQLQSVASAPPADDGANALTLATELAKAWTGTGYRFPPTSPSLPSEAAFRSILDKLNIELPLCTLDGDLFDAAGNCVMLVDDELFSEQDSSAFAELIRIALHVCAGEAAQKAL